MIPGSPDLIEVFRRVRMATTPVERDAILDAELGSDAATRELVLSLLRYDQADDSFLTRAIAVRLASPTESSTLVGQTLRPYRVLRRIGAGGFADVYEAEQAAPVRRTVALKVLKPYLVTPEVVRRFRAEQQALAAMAHPCIASVYDASETPDGRPFFVMEFVAGEPINAWVQRTTPSRAAIIEVLTRVCDAVQHAHDRGVIHRDIKSSNVLVTEIDGVPLPKVIDFGVAKALGESLADRSIVTGAAQIIGTLGAMSPEQLSPGKNPIDRRADVYALGALCFEALTGSPLYELKGLELPSAIRLISEGEPTSLHTQARALGSDLRAILTKATDIDKERRYHSPRELREDLLRARDHRPITARAPSWLDRTHRFAQRNKAVVVGIAATILALSLGLAISLAQAMRAAQAEALAESQRDDYAQVTRETVIALQQAIESLPGAVAANRVLVERTLASLELLAEHSQGEPQVLLDLSQAYRRIARLQGMPRGPNSGDRAAAIDSLDRAVALAEPVRDHPIFGAEATAAYLYSLLDLGETLMQPDTADQSLEVLLRALQACEERLDRDPRDLSVHNFFSGISWSAVRLLLWLDRPEEANEIVNRAAARLPDFDPLMQTSTRNTGNTMSCTYYVGTMLGHVGRFEEAEQYFTRAITEYQVVLDSGPTPSLWDLDFGVCERHLAIMRLRAGRPVEAAQAARDSLAILDRAKLTRPNYRPLEHIIIDTRLVLSRALREAEDFDESQSCAESCIQEASRYRELEPDANLWRMLLGDALAHAALTVKARCDRAPASCTVAALDQAVTYLDRALNVWADAGPASLLEDNPFGPDEARALRTRLSALAARSP